MTEKDIDDRIGSLLQQIVSRTEHEVIPPDPRIIVRRTVSRRLRRRVLSVAVVSIVVVGAVVASIALPGGTRTEGGDRADRMGQAPGVPSYPVQFGNVRLVVKDLPAEQQHAATIASSRITSLPLPVVTANNAAIAFGDGTAWVLEHTGEGIQAPCGRLVAVDVSSVTVRSSVPIAQCPEAVAYGAGAVWVLSFQIGATGYQLVQVDPSTLAIRSTITLDGGHGGATPQGGTGAKYLFVTVHRNDVVAAIQGQAGDAKLIEVDATSGTAIRSVPIPAADGPVTALSSNANAVWIGTVNGWVLSLDPEYGRLSNSRHLGTRVASLSASDAGIWVTVNLPVPANAPYPGLDTLRLHPVTGAIESDTGLPVVFVATDGVSVWVLSSAPPYLSAAGLTGNIDPATGQLHERADLLVEGGNAPDTLGVYQGAAWVIDDGAGRLTKVSP